VKAFLLAAGNGTRLRPLTDNVAKCMVLVRGVPLLEIWLQICRRFGIDEVLVNLHAHPESVRQYLRQHVNGIRVQVAEESELLGSAGTLLANRAWVANEECFWVFYADVLNRANLGEMMKLHRHRKPVTTLGVYRVSDPKRCGIVTVGEDGMISEFVEKPANPASNLAFSGLMIGSPELMEIIPEQLPADIGFHVLPKLGGRMLAFPINDYLIDVGTMENYLTAQATWPGLDEGTRGGTSPIKISSSLSGS
jgi:mannose-1-phosphate guanylyltransferase